MASRGTFACAINCEDGRVQIPVIEWLKARLKVDYIDMVTEPGPDKMLSSGSKYEVASIQRCVMISINAHHSRTVAIVAHHDCAGNPVDKKEHLKYLAECIKVVNSWQLPVRIITLYVNEEFAVELVSDSERKK